ncbi:hypothetical protein ACSFB7_08510 [Variovorax sp. GB1P17]
MIESRTPALGAGVLYRLGFPGRDFLALKLEQVEREIFAALFLDTQNRLIEEREMFWPRRHRRSRVKFDGLCLSALPQIIGVTAPSIATMAPVT